MAGSDFATLAIEIVQRGAKQTEDSLRKLSDTADRTERSFKKVERATAQQEKTQRRSNRTVKDATKEQDKFNHAATRTSGRLKVIGRDLNRYLILPMTAFIGLAARASYSLNDGLGNVQALIPDTGDRIYDLRDSVRDLATETGKSFDDITSGLYRTISVFQDNADTVERLNTAIRAGIAGYSTTAEAVQLLSSVTRSYGDTTAAAVDRVADLAFETIRLGDTTMPQLAGAMQVATDRAVRLGISQEELFATMSTLTGITGDASMVATQFRSAMDSLLNPTDAFNELLARMGYESAEAAIAEESMVGLLVRVAREAERAGRPLQDYITRKEGITLVSRLASEQLTDFAFKLGEIDNAAGAANEAFENVTEGVAKWNFEIRKSRERINSFMSEIGDNLLPILSDLLALVGDIVEGFSRLPEGVQRSTIAITGFAVVLSTVVQIFGALRGLKILAILGSLGQFMAKLTGVAKVLLVAVGAISGTAAVIAGVAAVLGLTYVRAQRKAEEAAELHRDRIEALNGELQELQQTASMTERSLQALALARESEFSSMGAVPTYRPTGEGDFEQTGMMYLSNLDGEDEIRRQIDQYSGMLDTLKDGFLTERKEMEAELVASTTPLMEGFIRRIENEGGEDGQDYDDWLKRLFPSDSAAREIMRGNIRENFDEIATLLMDEKERLQDQMDRGFIGAPQAQALDELTPLYETLTQLVGDRSQREQVTRDIQDAEFVQAEFMAIIETLTRFLEGSATELETTGTDWRKVFEQVTGVNVDGLSGVGASGVYNAFIEDMRTARAELAEALGGQVNEIENYTESIEKRINDFQGLLLDNQDTFGLQDYLFGGQETDIDYTDMIEGFRNDLSANIKLIIDDYTELTKETDTLMESFDNGQATIRDLEGALESYKDQLSGVENLESILSAANIDTTAVVTIIDAITFAIEELESKIGETVDAAGDLREALMFGAVLSSLGSASEVIKQSMFEVFAGIRDENKKLREEMGDTYDSLEIRSAVLADTIVDIGASVASGIAQSVSAMGQALGEFGKLGEGFAEIMANLWLSVLETIPALMIQAGLILIANGNVPVGLPLLAMGLGGTFISGYVQGRINKANTDSQDDVSGTTMNAKGAIINTPMTFSQDGRRNVAGEAGWESIMPLTRNANGELGVKAQGGGGTEVNVSVHNYAGRDVEVEERDDGNGNIELIVRKMIKNAVGSGAVDKEMRGRYGLSTSRA